MNRNANVRSVKPALEQLEGRDLPSFLLGGAVGQMAAPLQNMVTDMQNAEKDLGQQIQSLAQTNTQTQAEFVLGKVTADFQRIENDQHSIQAVSNADMAFVSAAALAEFQNGDSLDLAVLYFGPAFGLHPTSQLTDSVGQAKNTSDAAHNDITKLDSQLAFFNLPTIEQEAPVPSF